MATAWPPTAAEVRSLRGRLGLVFACGATVVTLVAAFFVAYGRWNEEQSQLPESVNLAAFELSESPNPDRPELEAIRGVDSFSVVFDADGNVMSSTGSVSEALLLVIEETIFANVTAFDFAVGYTFTDEDSVSDVLYGELVDDVLRDTDPAEEVEVLEPDAIDYITLDGETVGAELLAERFTAGATISVSGVRCNNQSVCDTVVVGAGERTPRGYLTDSWTSLLVPPLVAGLLALLASRWLVGRSLQPVDRMRAELDTITASDLQRRVPVAATGDELEQLGSSMNRTIERLESAITANERFVADAAHELRSPITGVRAALEVESKGEPTGLIGDSLDELDRASRLIDDLLVIARRQGGASTKSEVDLDDIVRSEVAAIRARFPDTSISATLEPARLHGDGDSLRRMVSNLLENGCLYGNGLLEVTLHGPRDANGARLRVEDDGPGVPPAERTRVFERFARLDESRARSTGGSGLGLAIAAEIVEDHGGSISISERPGGGARFEVALSTL